MQFTTRLYLISKHMDFDSRVNRYEAMFCDWLDTHKCLLISKKRALPTAIIAAQLFNEENILAVKGFGYSTLWLFGVDRWFDERSYTKSEVIHRCETVLQSLHHNDISKVLAAEEAELASTLIDLRDMMSQANTSFVVLQHAWLESLMDTLYLGMLFEHKNRATQMTYERYLTHARESIGVKFVNWTTFACLNEKIDPISYAELYRAHNLSAEIIRLINDCVTNNKEVKEGKKNAISILGLDPSLAQQKIAVEISKKHSELLELCDKKQGLPFFDYIRNLVQATLRFYEESDFYDDAVLLKKKYLSNPNKSKQ